MFARARKMKTWAGSGTVLTVRPAAVDHDLADRDYCRRRGTPKYGTDALSPLVNEFEPLTVVGQFNG
jgi:hypothetical protein